ncbi:hypothetical protein CEXT_204901 [Caerostris extrusa]|uniref:Uncharacterized protein n=1 Tax=Caerostris extrusa TaxID=172846 RepID=A0AAV4XLH4_CAEEX|nr:hypothetical protein CEXT_204901 [Caerostris extrusa]
MLRLLSNQYKIIRFDIQSISNATSERKSISTFTYLNDPNDGKEINAFRGKSRKQSVSLTADGTWRRSGLGEGWGNPSASCFRGFRAGTSMRKKSDGNETTNEKNNRDQHHDGERTNEINTTMERDKRDQHHDGVRTIAINIMME